MRVQICTVIIWSKLAFFLDPQLGPDNNPILDQIITVQNGPSGHLTWPLNPQKKKNKNKTKVEKTRNTKNELFSYRSFFLFWGIQNLLFWQLGPKARPQKHYKNKGFGKTIFGKQLTVTKRPFLDKSPNQETPVILFCCFFSLNNKTQTFAETPIFSVLENINKRISNIKLKTEKVQKAKFAPFFWKKSYC